ncbi:Ubiquilin-1 Protein linking IAP with cytoskeleton 1 [Collichthys lucidus]|uniref:Ubiquilin-1 Protein linking IAP with cytoskeleton 1 n=1 Tax=Collichthys lucidus TaxID=240159 RepID=A0A4U5UTS8_COLLU|nr:Ubiquilin-1 Protein linking IAP with cytoskeleton 1 [Collichthys lucidus]
MRSRVRAGVTSTTTFCRVIGTDTHLRPGNCAFLSRSAHPSLAPDRTEMSGAVKNEPRAPSDRQRCERIHVAVKSLTESKDYTVRAGCTVRQLKGGLAERMGVPAEQLVLIHSGRVLRESELLSHLKGHDDSVSICMIQRPQHSSPAPTNDPAPETVQSDLTVLLNPDNFTPSPTSPLCLVEGLDNLGLTNSGPGFFPALQRQMESQLLADPEMMCRLLNSPFVQNALSNSSPQLARQLIQSNPQIQELLQTNPEVEDMLNDTGVITQVLELIRNPDMIEEVMHHGDRALDNLQPQQGNPETITGDSDSVFQNTDTKRLKLSQTQTGVPPVVTTSSEHQQPAEKGSKQTPPFSSHSTDPLRGLTATPRADPNPQSTVTAGKKITNPHSLTTLRQKCMHGHECYGKVRHAVAARGDYSQPRTDGEPAVWATALAARTALIFLLFQMLLSHPLFSGNPQLQQQMREQIPLFLQQMQGPELLSAMLNPRAMEALLQIQQALQTLAAEAPALIPTAGLGNIGANANTAPELGSNNQSGSGPGVATVTERQQQQFVQQMLQTLANGNYGVSHCFLKNMLSASVNHLSCS